ncbi:MauE/DoxX family redox-associated membrane protein [Mucilaginibacter lappiensis]|uniref:Putative membrane protein YphA (DoxX/SURF4 family) n=1 Tax=Mucilaginibacter lappiensis TaxID=354630 RepID=A0A841JPW9_9SPHI|nr:MauE/DoxX family redox-associated membrane protein [Mucilaginibacter lappiensis]MBB6130808.1 putative membrane protein YphA (DoxX/SURF4 family) [Mucilaginibacter lappiensis]
MKKETILKIIVGVIAAMFGYAASIKLADYPKSQAEMLNQVFPVAMAEALTWLIPVIEMTLIVFLLLPATRKIATWASFLLLSAFSVYILLASNDIFSRTPCSCGGILWDGASYLAQLIFNICFIVLSLISLTIENGWIKNISWFHLKHKKQLVSNSA